jgi:hypothetical protein
VTNLLKHAGEIQVMPRSQKGLAGNPAGKPKGACDKRTALRELLTPHAKDLIEKTVELAKSGDTTALRLCLERIVAPSRAKDEAVVVEQVGNTLSGRAQAIVNTSLTGQITPSEAATLLQALATQARITEAEELESRRH